MSFHVGADLPGLGVSGIERALHVTDGTLGDEGGHQVGLGLLAQTPVSLAFSTVHTVDWETGLPAVAEATRLAEENPQPR